MPLRIFNNLSSTIAQNRLSDNNQSLGQVIGRIASGNRLSGYNISGADKSVSELLRSDSRTLRQATKNLNDGISLINVAEGGLNEQAGILTRLREVLSVAGGAIGQNERGNASRVVNGITIAKVVDLAGKVEIPMLVDCRIVATGHQGVGR